MIANIANYSGEIVWDSSKQDGTPKKQLDISRLTSLGWRSQISLEDGLQRTINLYQEEINKIF